MTSTGMVAHFVARVKAGDGCSRTDAKVEAAGHRRHDNGVTRLRLFDAIVDGSGTGLSLKRSDDTRTGDKKWDGAHQRVIPTKSVNRMA